MKPLSQSACLLAVSDGFVRSTLRSLLTNIRFGHLVHAEDGAAAIHRFRQNPSIDIIIAQEDLPVALCTDIAHFVRFDRNSPRQDLPIISVGQKWTREKIVAARDAGIDTLVQFPISQHILQSRILSTLYSRRDFVTTDRYCGPTRRSAQSHGYQGPFRRACDAKPGQSAEPPMPPVAAASVIHPPAAPKPPPEPTARQAAPTRPAAVAPATASPANDKQAMTDHQLWDMIAEAYWDN